MSGRALAVLALAAVLAVAAAWYVRQPEPATGPAADEALFLPGLADRLPAVTAVRARVAGGRELAHVVRDGDRWRVRNRAGYPADPATLRGTLIALSEVPRGDARTDRPEGWARLGLAPIEESGAEGVELTLEGLDPPLRVLIGKPAAGDASGTYLRRVGDSDARAWLVERTIERPDAIADWLDDRLVGLAPRRLQGVEISPRDGEPVRVARVGRRAEAFELANRPEDRQPLSNSIAYSIARVVADLRLTDVHPAETVELPQRLARARFETRDGLRLVIDAFAATRGETPHYIRLRASTADGAKAAVEEEAAELNSRFDGWLYAIPDYKFVNLTQTLEGVLEDPR